MATATATRQLGGGEYTEYTSATRVVIMVAVMLGTLMQMIDSSIVNVAIPTMMGNLGVTLSQISWVTTGYILANVVVLPMTGWLSSVFGRRRYLAGSMALFTVASVACGASHSLGMLVFFRIVQGIGGAALMSTAQATLMEIFPPQQIAAVQAVFGIGIMLGPSIGPTLGGWITDNFSWPWIFYINLPIGAIAVVMTLLFMHDSRHERGRGSGIDWAGILFLAVGLGCLQTLLEKGTSEDWFESTLITRLAVGAALGLILFVYWELRARHPVVNLRILRHRSFTAGNVFGLVLGFGLFGGIFILPVYLQNLRHYTAMQSGLILLPSAVAAALGMPLAARAIRYVSPRVLTAMGLAGALGATWMLSTITLDMPSRDLFTPLVIRGLALGFMMLPLTLATLADLRGHEIAEGTALFNLSRQLGGSIGIAALSTFLDHRIRQHYVMMNEHVSLFNAATRYRLNLYEYYFRLEGAAASVAHLRALEVIRLTIMGQAMILSYEDIFRVMVLVFLVSAPLLLLFRKGKLNMSRPGPARE
jgi:DHA2 family multidrug resistance protein